MQRLQDESKSERFFVERAIEKEIIVRWGFQSPPTGPVFIVSLVYMIKNLD